jgi:hypothetical protein
MFHSFRCIFLTVPLLFGAIRSHNVRNYSHFPCQLFLITGVSKNALGHAQGIADETQGTLFFNVAYAIACKKPKAFLLENVKNLWSHDKGRTFWCFSRRSSNPFLISLQLLIARQDLANCCT